MTGVYTCDILIYEFSLVTEHLTLVRKNMLVPVFFFQAEDGIRDRDVTGVQTVLFRSPPL